MKVAKGNKITVEYEGRFEDGEVFDSSSHGDHSHPLEFQVGSGEVIEKFDKAVVGLEEGEEIEFEVEPKEGYGEYDTALTQEIPKEFLQGNQEPKAGMAIVIDAPDGRQFPLKIIEVRESTLVLDMNHPLAGKKLIFKVKIISIED